MAAAFLVVAGLFVAAPPASAADGVVTRTVSWYNHNDPYRGVQFSSLSITWARNTIDGSEWVTIKATFRDSKTDGRCARFRFGPTAYDTSGDTVFAECNGIYVTRSKTYNAKYLRAAHATYYSNYASGITYSSWK